MLIVSDDSPLDPLPFVTAYLRARDAAFPFHPQLWLRANGDPPRRAWFVRRLARHFPRSISGHSLRAGGATALAAMNWSNDQIKPLGRWSSNAFLAYKRKHPALLAAMLERDRALGAIR